MSQSQDLNFRRPQGRRRKLLATGLLTLALASGVAGAQLLTLSPSLAKSDVTESTTHNIAGLPNSFSALVEQVSPAVVNISVTQAAEMPEGMAQVPQLPPGMEGSPMEDFLKRFFEGVPQDQNQRPVQAVGSGFIIDPSGYVVTNNHVADHASAITVTLNDGTSLPATLLGQDAKTDLALLKVESDKPLPYVKFGDSDNADVGDWVVAVGNPFGLGGTVTAGIVSARGRDLGAGPFDDFLQIDAPINRGNSGGPLFNTAGEVIGINSAIYSPNGGSVGIGFAIPAALAQPVLAQLRENGQVERGWLGVRIQEVTKELAEGLGLKAPEGALIAKVDPKGPAAASGLHDGDVILSFDGKPVEELRDLPRLVAGATPGSDAKVRVWRDGAEKSLTVEIGKMPGEEPRMAAHQPAEASDRVLGLGLAKLTESERARLGLEEDVTGVLVMDVANDSKAAQQGIHAGDVIRKIDGLTVDSPSDVAEAVAKAEKAKRDAVVLLVSRGDDQRFVALSLAMA